MEWTTVDYVVQSPYPSKVIPEHMAEDCHQLHSWAKDGQKWLLGFHTCQSWSACVGNYEQLSGTNPITGHKRHAYLPLVLGACSLVVWWGRKGIDQTLNVVKGTDRDREKAVGNRCKVILSAVSRFLRQTDRLGKRPDFSFFFIPSQKQRDKDCPCKEFGKCLQTIYLVKFLFWGFFSLKK